MEHLLDFFIPKTYHLTLFIDKFTKTLQGHVEILGSTTDSEFIKLHTVDQTIDFVKINGKEVDFKIENCVLTALAAPRSDFRVEVGFHGSLGETMQGAYLSTFRHQNADFRLVSTQFESHYARQCFPCIDEPAAKATFLLTLVVPAHNPANPSEPADTLLANTPVAVEKTLSSLPEPLLFGHRPAYDSYRVAIFKETPRMSTYLLAFVVGPLNFLESKTKSGVVVRTYASLDQSLNLLKFPNEVAVKALEYYEDLFGLPYPLPKLDQVAIPDFEAGAMENWGLVTYRESQLLCAPDASLGVKTYAAITITHELSHQWFGNLVTMAWWNDLWLNESFASVMEYFCTDHIFPEYCVWYNFFTSSCLSAFYRDAVAGVQAVREDVEDPAEIATLFDPCIVYAKGAHLIFMLLREMGEKNFFAGLRDYFARKKYSNATADDLWDALNPYADFDVKDYMTAWLTQPGYPVVTDEVQQRFLLDGSTDDSQYPIPVLRDDMSGHYLINLSSPEFSAALDDFAHLSDEQRLRLLIDRLLLAETPLVSSASLLPLLDKFKHETFAPLWTILDTIIAKLTLFIDFDSPEEEKYKNYLYSLVSPQLKRLGLTYSPSESTNDTELRTIFLANALYSKNPAFLADLNALCPADFTSLDPNLRPFVLSAKMWLEEETFYPQVLEAYKTATDPALRADLRSALAKPRLPENIDFAFAALKNSDLIKPQDHLGFLLRLRHWRYTRDRALAWLLANWDYVVKITGEKSVEDYPRYFASTIDREDDATRFLDFFNQFSDSPILARTLRVAKNDIDSTLTQIKLDKSSVLRAINRLPL